MGAFYIVLVPVFILLACARRHETKTRRLMRRVRARPAPASACPYLRQQLSHTALSDPQIIAVRDNADREGVLWSLGCLPYLAHDDRHDESEWDENDGDLALGHGEHADVEMALASEAAGDCGRETAGGEAGATGAMPNRSHSGAASSSGDADAAGAAEAAAGEDQSMRWKELAARSEARLAAAQQSPDAAQDGVDSPGPDADSLPQPYAHRPTRTHPTHSAHRRLRRVFSKHTDSSHSRHPCAQAAALATVSGKPLALRRGCERE